MRWLTFAGVMLAGQIVVAFVAPNGWNSGGAIWAGIFLAFIPARLIAYPILIRLGNKARPALIEAHGAIVFKNSQYHEGFKQSNNIYLPDGLKH